MSEYKFSDINFGATEAEHDLDLIQIAFWETEQWKRANSDLLLPLIIGRKGSGKSAIAIKLSCKYGDEGNYLSFVPNDFRHVEIRELLSKLINKNVSWQYIYTKVWEGIILGQIVRHFSAEDNKSLYYDFSDDLKKEIKLFKNFCPFYVDALDDALGEVINKYLLSNNGELKDVSLVALRKQVEPYKWSTLITSINDEFKGVTRHKKVIFCIDGLDEHWDTSEPSLYFLAQLLHVIKNLSNSLKDSVKFFVCLRDNIFRTLVDTGSIEYDKLESSINYLVWDNISLFALIAKRAFPHLSNKDALRNFKNLLPESVDGIGIEDYLGQHVVNRPRDYINFFKLLQTLCQQSVTKIHISDAVSQYCANRLIDLENEFGLTYPHINEVISALYGLPNQISKDQLKIKLEEICRNEQIKLKAKELMLHHGQPEKLARILISIGVLGIFDDRECVIKFIHEFSESRVSQLYELNNQFGLHPVYTYTKAKNKAKNKEKNTGPLAVPVVHPTDYVPQKDNLRDITPISQHTVKLKLEVIADITAIRKGQQDFRRFETWVQKAFELCFLNDISNVRSQVPSHEGQHKFEILFDIHSDECPWQEIKNKFRTHRLLIECKNTDTPTDDDFNKLSRDMDQLDSNVAFIVYRSDLREPSKLILDKIRNIWNSRKRTKVIIAITENFVLQCLRKPNEAKCRQNLNSIWQDHLERWLI